MYHFLYTTIKKQIGGLFMVEFDIYLMFKLYKLVFKTTSDNGNSFVPSPNSNFMKKRI